MRQVVGDIVEADHNLLLVRTAGGQNRYRILRDYSGTYIEKQMESEERMINPIFRVFEAAKPERQRKLNINPVYEFSVFSDSLFDYGSIIGYKLRKPWHLFNRLIAVHIPLCPNDCWHCYVPKELYVTDETIERHVEMTARAIVDAFRQQHDIDRMQNKQSNVLRITGGEPFLVPEMILEILQCIEQDGLSDEIFVWTETNLEPFVGPEGQAFMDKQANRDILNGMSSFKNFCVHPCFHGLSPQEFDDITGKEYGIRLDEQIAALKRLVVAKIDVYPTFGTNVCDPVNIKSLFDGLKTISTNLPLKVALVKYDDYQPVATRLAPNTSRRPLLYSRFAALRIWNELLMHEYGIGYGVYPRQLVTYTPPMVTINDQNPPATSKGEEIIYFFKSSYRELYHREVLDILALPAGHIFEISYDKPWVQEDVFFHMGRLPELYKGKKCVWFYVDQHSLAYLPLRYGEIVDVKDSTGVLSIKIKIREYLTFSDNAKEDRNRIRDNIKSALKEYFGSSTLPQSGKFVLLGEDFTIKKQAGIEEYSVSPAFGLREVPFLSSDFTGFFRNVDQLTDCQDMKKSLFYRLTLKDIEMETEQGRTLYTIEGGKSFKISIEYYLPNYQEFDERQPKQRTLVVKSSNPKIQIVGSSSLVFSKYGNGEIIFRTDNVTHTEDVAVVIHSPFDAFKAANITLTIRLKPTRVADAFYSLLAAGLLGFASIGYVMLSKMIEKGDLSPLTTMFELYHKLTPFSVTLVLSFSLVVTACFWCVFYFKSAGVSGKL